MRLELIRVCLLVKLANHYTTKGALRLIKVIEKKGDITDD